MFLELSEELSEKFKSDVLSLCVWTSYRQTFEHTHTLFFVEGAHLALSVDRLDKKRRGVAKAHEAREYATDIVLQVQIDLLNDLLLDRGQSLFIGSVAFNIGVFLTLGENTDSTHDWIHIELHEVSQEVPCDTLEGSLSALELCSVHHSTLINEQVSHSR